MFYAEVASSGYYKSETPFAPRDPPARNDDGNSQHLLSPASNFLPVYTVKRLHSDDIMKSYSNTKQPAAISLLRI